MTRVDDRIIRHLERNPDRTFNLDEIVDAVGPKNRREVKDALLELLAQGVVLKLWPPKKPHGVPLAGDSYGYEFQLKEVVMRHNLWAWVVQ